MATISLRLDDQIRDELEAKAKANGISTSELIRRSITSLLGYEVDNDRERPTFLSKQERLQISLLHEILQRLTKDEHHESIIEALRSGYTTEYETAFDYIEDELSPSDCRLLYDILDMFRVIKASLSHVGVEKVNSLHEHSDRFLTFQGFDANDRLEGRMCSYTQYLIKNGRWQDLALYFDDDHERGNSHMPVLSTYKRMLDTYRPIFAGVMAQGGHDRYTLSAEDLASIAQACILRRR